MELATRTNVAAVAAAVTATAVAAALAYRVATSGVAGGGPNSKAAARRRAELLERYGGEEIVHLFGFPRWSYGPSVSSYTTRVEAFLRLATIPYELHELSPKDAAALSPSGAVPFIIYDNRFVTDSAAIIEWLTVHFCVAAERALSPEQRAASEAWRALCDYHLMPYVKRDSIESPGAAQLLEAQARAFGFANAGGRLARVRFIEPFKRRLAAAQRRSGVGLLPREQYEALFIRDLDALEATLLDGDRDYLLGGATATAADCCVYGVLSRYYLLITRLTEGEAAAAAGREGHDGAHAGSDSEVSVVVSEETEVVLPSARPSAITGRTVGSDGRNIASPANNNNNSSNSKTGAKAAADDQEEEEESSRADPLASQSLPVRYLAGSAVLMGYLARLTEELFPDMAELTAPPETRLESQAVSAAVEAALIAAESADYTMQALDAMADAADVGEEQRSSNNNNNDAL